MLRFVLRASRGWIAWPLAEVTPFFERQWLA
jgi:hypothetical protein